jgi:hemerythrin
MDTTANQTWNNSYLLDIIMIDKQHMHFFKIFDQLLVLNKNFENYLALAPLIDELEKYTKVHFKTEEALMVKANVQDIDLHIAQHEIFIEKIDAFKTAYSYQNTVLLEQMIIFMRKWFLMHISEVDRKYAEPVQKYLEKREIKEM